jgi:Ca-activated chloride channel family protein
VLKSGKNFDAVTKELPGRFSYWRNVRTAWWTKENASMTFRNTGVLLIATMATAICLSAQEPGLQMNVTTSRLSLDVIVKDSDSRPVLDLKQSDFEIYEDGQLQTTRLFTLAEAPRSTMLIFDRSGSAEQQEPFMLQAINSFTRTMRPSDRIGIFSFANELEVQLRWRAIGNGPFPTVKMPATQTWSAVYDSIDRAEKRFDNEKGRKGIIMLTDGQDSYFYNETKRLGGVLEIEKDGNFQKYLQKIRKQGIPVYFVALLADPRAEFAYLNGSEYRTSSDYVRSGLRSPTVGADYVLASRQRMVKIAEVTGGRILVSARLEDVASFYEQIARELGQSYSLEYAPDNIVEGGKYRRIEVRVRRPGLVVTQSRGGFQP